MKKGRFAPSSSWRMHLGNIITALLAWLDVRSVGGVMVLRMEDLDPERCREEYAAQFARDLEWLGLDWDEGYGSGGSNGFYRQSERSGINPDALDVLGRKGLVYPCWCSRAQRLAASAPHPGEDWGDGRCHCPRLSLDEQGERPPSGPESRGTKQNHWFYRRASGYYEENLADQCGDFIIRRSDGVCAYRLAVTVDDALIGITRAVRAAIHSVPRRDRFGCINAWLILRPIIVIFPCFWQKTAGGCQK